jgi:tight adherence protein B
MSPLLGALLGILSAGGVLLIWAGATRTVPPVRPAGAGRVSRATSRLSRRQLGIAAAAAGVGVLLAAMTGWVVAVVVLPAAALALPALLRKDYGAADIAKMEALEEWVRLLRGVIVAGMPLTEALVRTLDAAPAAILPQVEMLVARLQARRPLDQALYSFADQVDDPLGDLVASSLILGASESGVGMGRALESLAGMLTKKVRSRRRIESERSGLRKQARMVMLIVGVTFPLFVTTTQFGRVYHTAVGQMALVVFVTLFGLCFWWLHKRASFPPLPRFLVTPRERGKR